MQRRFFFASVGGLLGAYWLPTASAWDEQRFRALQDRRSGPSGVRRLNAWLTMLVQQQGQPLNQQLDVVNAFWNTEVLAGLDSAIWRTADYWATPLETLGKGSGDCDDFVIGKYFSLIRLGVPFKKMRLIYVRARTGGINSPQDVAHMVLGFYENPTSDPLVLDNLVDKVRPASQRTDLRPVFSFDAESVYVGSAVSAASSRINRWQDLLGRMRQEGFDV